MWAYPTGCVGVPYWMCGRTLLDVWAYPTGCVGVPTGCVGVPTGCVGVPYWMCGCTYWMCGCTYWMCGCTLLDVWVYLLDVWVYLLDVICDACLHRCPLGLVTSSCVQLTTLSSPGVRTSTGSLDMGIPHPEPRPLPSKH